MNLIISFYVEMIYASSLHLSPTETRVNLSRGKGKRKDNISSKEGQISYSLVYWGQSTSMKFLNNL